MTPLNTVHHGGVYHVMTSCIIDCLLTSHHVDTVSVVSRLSYRCCRGLLPPPLSAVAGASPRPLPSERLGAGIGGQAAGLTLAQIDLVQAHPLALHRLLPQARLRVKAGVRSGGLQTGGW